MSDTKHNWTKEEILEIYNKPLMELLYEAATVHRVNHDPNVVQVSTLLSIKLVVVVKIVGIVLKLHATILILKATI
ncbi:biotin synthase [Algibacter lectus]|uniref:Biotin synthase n=1 Tax=Algibacter lectus TaxID=221126 RepID=A0A090V788_9FLAO|nr:biotin synthase [Algibacter lectus]